MQPALTYNYYALMVSIFTDADPDTAFQKLGVNSPTIGKYIKFTDHEKKCMTELKKTHTYDAIGKMYGITESSVYRHIARYKQKKGMS